MIKQLRIMAMNHPDDARNLLLLHPELVFGMNLIIDSVRGMNE